jgi:hypothetical protein
MTDWVIRGILVYAGTQSILQRKRVYTRYVCGKKRLAGVGCSSLDRQEATHTRLPLETAERSSTKVERQIHFILVNSC